MNTLLGKPEFNSLKLSAIEQAEKFVQKILSEEKPDINYEKLNKKLQILRQVLSLGGQVNKEMHSMFWKDMPADTDGKRILTVKWLLKNLNTWHVYQKALWNSALESWEDKKIVRTKELQDTLKKMDKAIKEENPFKKGSIDYKEFIKDYQMEMKKSFLNADLLLESCSKRTPFKSYQGEIIMIDDVYIRIILDSMDASFRRAENLLNPVWQE